MGKVPALTHRGTVVTETGAICAYLADAFPAAGLAPPLGDPRRGPYFRWMFFAAGPVEAVVTGKALDLLAPPDKKRMAGYGSYEETVDALEQAVLAGPYICGDGFTAADVYVGSQIAWPMMFKMLPERQPFLDYVARLKERPAFQRASQLDEESTPKQEA
jgi:glutathione S-transferase